MNRYRLVMLMFTMICSTQISAQIFKGFEHLFTKPLQYTCYRTGIPLKIDGIPDEEEWNKIPWSEHFSDIEGDRKPAPEYPTRFKMLWDDQYLYVTAEMKEPHLWAFGQKRDEALFLENDFEIFIDPDNDTHHYFEYQINAYNNIFDLYLSMPYRNKGKMMKDWDINDLQKAVQLQGTLNNATDRDQQWTVEFAIPFAELRHNGYIAPLPKDKDFWRVNFLRVQWDLEIKDGNYTRKKDPASGKLLPEHNWSWSAPGLVSMHYPERYGYVFFSRENAGGAPVKFSIPFSEDLKNYLWLIYYKQAEHFNKHALYANELQQLEVPATITNSTRKKVNLQLKSTGKAYISYLNCDNLEWSIDQNGLVKKTNQ